MISKHIQNWTTWLQRVISHPRSELTRWQRFTRFAYDLGRYGARQLRRDRAPQMAAALAFRTLFSMIPVLVVATVIVRAFKGVDEFRAIIVDGIDAMGLHQFGRPLADGEQPGEVRETIGQFVMDLFTTATEINIAAIGWVGAALLIYAAISLMVTIENSFNSVCQVQEGRPWMRRVPTYWSVLTIGPVVIGLTAYLNGWFETWIESFSAWQWLLTTAGFLAQFLTLTLYLFAMYMLVPNRSFAWKYSLSGAITAALLIEIGKRLLGVYVSNAVSIQQFEGSLFLVPLFMLWAYIMWLVILFGLEVAATLHALGGRTLEQLEKRKQPTGVVDPAAVISVMHTIAGRFKAGNSISAAGLAEVTGIPIPTIDLMLEHLQVRGHIHRVRDGAAVTLARPPEQIDAEELVQIGFDIADESRPTEPPKLLRQLREAQRNHARGQSLAGMMA